MFGLGMMEIGVIIVLAVMLFPPKELPNLARTIARAYGQIRKTAEDFRSSVLEDEDLRSPIDEIKGAYNDARFEIRDAERKARQQLAKAQMEMRMATARRIQAEAEQPAATPVDPAAGEGPVRIAAGHDDDGDDDDGDDDADAHEGDARAKGPVAGADPRKLAAARAKSSAPSAPASVVSDRDGDEPREGVA